ncbi:hypothetical protein M0R45_025448 [Rubus argutus]|uniref:Uncharacterized protein n=1 Tax=Rubus argutus TaxID=59490 RepID=A0AAW1WY84_RUBAR
MEEACKVNSLRLSAPLIWRRPARSTPQVDGIKWPIVIGERKSGVLCVVVSGVEQGGNLNRPKEAGLRLANDTIQS